MQLFAGLRRMREFERLQLSFMKSLIDFDIIIEIGYGNEQNQPLTPKQLFLLNLSSVTTVRRRLVMLTKQGIIKRRTNPNDRRSTTLSISSSSLKLLGKYQSVLASLSV